MEGLHKGVGFAHKNPWVSTSFYENPRAAVKIPL